MITNIPVLWPIADAPFERGRFVKRVDYPAFLPDFLAQRVQPHIAVRSAVQRSVKEALSSVSEKDLTK